MLEILRYIKEHVTAFVAGFTAGGVPVFIFVLHVPPMLGFVGFALKLLTTILFASAGGLATVLVTDLYKHYFRGWILAQTDKLSIFIRKRFNHDKERDKNKAA